MSLTYKFKKAKIVVINRKYEYIDIEVNLALDFDELDEIYSEYICFLRKEGNLW